MLKIAILLFLIPVNCLAGPYVSIAYVDSGYDSKSTYDAFSTLAGFGWRWRNVVYNNVTVSINHRSKTLYADEKGGMNTFEIDYEIKLRRAW